MKPVDIAESMTGLHENKDTKKLNEFILKHVPAWRGLSVNSTAWCAAFVNACEKEAGNPGNNKLNARSFLTYGTKVDVKGVERGDIAIFSRGGSTWMGHVAYVDKLVKGQNGETLVRCIGGNQSDSVSVGWYPLSRLLGFRRYQE